MKQLHFTKLTKQALTNAITKLEFARIINFNEIPYSERIGDELYHALRGMNTLDMIPYNDIFAYDVYKIFVENIVRYQLWKISSEDKTYVRFDDMEVYKTLLEFAIKKAELENKDFILEA